MILATSNMKFFVVLIIIALIPPLYAQSEEKDVEKRGIYGLGTYGLSSLSYRVPVVTRTIHGGYGGHGFGGYGYGFGGYGGYGGYGNYFGW